jgi:hypothetical protein
MDHRRFLAHPEAHRPFAGGDLFARIGGRAAIDTLVDAQEGASSQRNPHRTPNPVSSGWNADPR